MKHLLRDNHEDRAKQRKHIHRAIEIYRALLAGGVVERLDEPDEKGRYVRLTVDLQYDFALNQPLSPFALAAIELLDRESESYALDVLSVIESTLDDPRQILSAQQFRARGEAVAEMKAEGIEYEERMELLDNVTWPKPLEDVLEAGYDIYRRGHPWVGDYMVSPKAIVRDMYERAMTFGEYVQFYALSRSEGIVLRYLADAYKALKQTVPDEAKTEELADLIEWLGELIRQVDSSLIDEWEKLSHPDPDSAPVRAEPRGVTRNTRAFRVLVRNSLFRRVTLASLRRLRRPRRPRRRRRLDRGRLGGGARRLLRAVRRDRHRPGRARPVDADHRGGQDRLDRPADLRRPGRRPRLGHLGHGRPRRLRRGRHRHHPRHRRRPTLRTSSSKSLSCGTDRDFFRSGAPFRQDGGERGPNGGERRAAQPDLGVAAGGRQ